MDSRGAAGGQRHRRQEIAGHAQQKGMQRVPTDTARVWPQALQERGGGGRKE